MKEDLLLELITKLPLSTSAKVTEYFIPHYEFTIGIGADESATIIMAKEAYETLVNISY